MYKEEVTRCPTCGSMLEMNYGEDDFQGVKNEIATCSFVSVDVRRLKAYEEALKTIDNTLVEWVSKAKVTVSQIRTAEELVNKALRWRPPRPETILSIAAWHEATFPDATEQDQKMKWSDECYAYITALQAGRTTEAKEELADLFIVAVGMMRWNMANAIIYMNETLDIAKKHNHKIPELQAVIDYKMRINRGRTWDCKDGKYQHKEDK